MRLEGVGMMNSLRRLIARDAGVTLVELGVGMAITALLATLMVTWLAAGIGSDTSHRSYDEAIADLRHVTDQLAREIRTASGLTSLGDHSLSLWLDGDRDEIVDPGEIVTWQITGSDMVRATDDAAVGAVLATNLSQVDSLFTYDSDDPVSVTRVTIDLVALARTRAGSDAIEHSVDVYLRNS